MHGHRRQGAAVWLALVGFVGLASAVTPSGDLEVLSGSGSTYTAPAGFGPYLPEETDALELELREPDGWADGCNPTIADQSSPTGAFALVTARSPNCTFQDRALAAQGLGASALIVYNTLEGIYKNRTYGEKQTDYECDNGASWVDGKGGARFEGFRTSKCATDSACDSGRCLLTGNKRAKSGGTQYQICCAWDLYMEMAGDPYIEIAIPAVFLTMSDHDALARNNLQPTSSSSVVRSQLFNRPLPWMNFSSVLLWALGVVTCAYASWRSADEQRRKNARIAEGAEAAAAAALGIEAQGRMRDGAPLTSDAVVATPAKEEYRRNGHGGGAAAAAEAGAAHAHGGNGGGGGQLPPYDDEDEEPPALELTTGHAFGFIIVASSALLVLFFVDLYLTVNVLFSFSAASSTAQVLWRPFYSLVLGARARAQLFETSLFGSVSLLDVSSLASGVFLAVWWFTCRNSSYAWALQDTFGMCLVVLFLSVIRLSNVKVAALLLCMAFVYDIFFVFISPLIFSTSVMVKVATGDGPTADPDYCEKYPDDSDCTTTSLPMLLLLPRVDDYTGGYTMLGLGDIVLPGLLVSFAIRYDTSIGRKIPYYYLLMVAGYSVGLMMANVAVYVMDMGQPALLYLVPCTLGVFCAASHREGTLAMMWSGPPSLNNGLKSGQEMRPCTSDVVAVADMHRDEGKSLLG